LFAFAAVGCGAGGGEGSGGTEDGGQEQVQVATTMTVIQDLAEEVGGDRVEVSSIVEPGADVHAFQPSPSDAEMVSEAEVVFGNGLGLEEWLYDFVESAGADDAAVVELSDGLDPTGTDEHAGEEEHSEEGHEEEEHSGEEHADEESGSEEGAHDAHAGGNPHFWLDVEYAGHYVEGIRDELIEADPEGEEQYRENAEEYLAELEELDGYIEEKAQEIPEENRKLVTFHDAFPYFAEAYGFELEGVILQNPNAEPSSREVAEVVETIEEEDVPAVFTEPQFNQGLADTIAQEADVEVYELYSGALIEGEAGESYEAMMRTNIDRVAEALG
jgi:zinc/manganese transport system substrate-binding protein/manganese/iron transport system substrate-binding protein